MMKHKSAVLLLPAIFAAVSCFGIGDAGLTVKGEVVDQKGAKIEGCKLELRMEKNDFLADWQQIGSPFEQTFTISPGTNRLFFVILCEGASLPYRTKVFVVKGAERFEEPIDLGTIRVERR